MAGINFWVFKIQKKDAGPDWGIDAHRLRAFVVFSRPSREPRDEESRRCRKKGDRQRTASQKTLTLVTYASSGLLLNLPNHSKKAGVQP
jgi:hypothetical protein